MRHGGGDGIQTHGTGISGSAVYQTAPIGHSGTPPHYEGERVLPFPFRLQR
jgi:hypothetical protein